MPSLKTVEALCSAAMKQQLHDTLVSLALANRGYLMMPADIVDHYNSARRAIRASQESGEPLGWIVWQQLEGQPHKLDYAVRRMRVAESLEGNVFPLGSNRRRLKRRGPLPPLPRLV
ncbi:hypothetical protein ACFCQI_02885 [Rhodanobacter sp. FW102-FHT14D06]|uniref:Uncharacterized protein n=2 Tax=unclassified Rhodanobacter TaxID=2621553 RepID=A0AB74UW81_9GAMM